MSIHEELILDVIQILLDPINPRHDQLQHQVELMSAMIDDQRDKLVKLAEDIVANGLNPSDLIAVIPHQDEKGKYVVVEGNRRITALKLIANPAMCKDASIKKRFEALQQKYSENPISSLKCVVFPDRKSANHWITLKHTGENDGVGTVRWDATAIKRFEAQDDDKKQSPGLQLLNFILQCRPLDENTAKIIRNIPISTVERLLNDPDIRKPLGLVIDNGELKSRLNMESASKVLYDFFVPFATGDKNVKDVYYKGDRKKYLEEFGSSPGNDPSKLTKTTWLLETPPKGDLTALPNPVPTTTRQQSKPLSTARRYLIPSSCVLKIDRPRINAIYLELRRELVVTDVPNACAVLLRVFLEASIDYFLEAKTIPSHENDKLHTKICKVADYMESNGILNKKDLKPARNAASKKDGLFTTNTLNAYVHNPTIHPRPDDLKLTWDEMESFVKKMWE